MPRDPKQPRLGRGLSALIRPSAELSQPGQFEPVAADDRAGSVQPAGPLPRADGIRLVRRESIGPNPNQPRRFFDDGAIAQLADSIRSHGLLQPVLVRPLPLMEGHPNYELIAGERRLRAAELAGLEEIPCLIRRAEPKGSLELALVENIHRADLNPVERASAYRRMMDSFGLTQQDVADAVGEPRATVANYLRILDLCDEVQRLLLDGALSFGHAKVLAALAGDEHGQSALARRAVKEGLSVRVLEDLVASVRAGDAPATPDKQGRSPAERPAYVVEVERQLSEALGCRVAVRPGRRKNSGRIVIPYNDLEGFDRVLSALGVSIES